MYIYCICSRYRVVLCSSLPCLCTLYRSIPTWNEVLQRLFGLVCVVFWGLLNWPSYIEPIARYSLCYSPPNTLSADSKSTSYMYAMVFCAGLNNLQVDEVNRENDSWNSRQTLFIASKLTAAYSACVFTSQYTPSPPIWSQSSIRSSK